MMKKTMLRCVTILLAVLLASLSGAGAEGGRWSLPYAGFQMRLAEDWTVIYSDLTKLRLQTEDGATVVVTVWEGGTPDAAAYEHEPYRDVGFLEERQGVLSMAWTSQGTEGDVHFLRWLLSRDGMLYDFTAQGADEARVRELLGAVMDAVEFIPVAQADGDELPGPAPSVADDGVNTPIELLGYSGITYEDETELVVRTLPGAQVTLVTSGSRIYRAADDEGLCSFTLSNKREMTYTYTIASRAPSRRESRVEITVERRLDSGSTSAAYRKKAVSLEKIDYRKLAANPDRYAETAVHFRGMSADWSELDGFPCLLVYTVNPAKGVWKNPVWLQITGSQEVGSGEIRSYYGDILGVSLPFGEKSVPVIRLRGVAEE